MPYQFTVPQFIEVEDKILGPVTVRQFVIMLVTCGVVFLYYKIFDFALFALAGLPTLGAGFVMAFVKVNGQPFHYFLLNLAQTLRKPKIRIWDKTISEAELNELIKAPEVKPPQLPPRKPLLEASKLTELSLIVNTGGVYRPEE